MFGPEIVIGAEVYVELLELIAISQRTFGDVQNVFRLFIHSEHQRLSSVFDCSTDLYYVKQIYYKANNERNYSNKIKSNRK